MVIRLCGAWETDFCLSDYPIKEAFDKHWNPLVPIETAEGENGRWKIILVNKMEGYRTVHSASLHPEGREDWAVWEDGPTQCLKKQRVSDNSESLKSYQKL